MAAILVVDDEPSPRTTMALLLKTRGHRVREADGVAAAVRVLASDPPDLVVTDLRMPDGVGLDVLRAAKAHCPEADVILLTAYAGWESAKEAMKLGAVDYFEKGNDPEGLLRRIERCLEEQARRRNLLTARAALEGERAFLTVLFADLRGSLELLSGRDLEEARAILDGVLERMMEAVHHHGGTVNQVMGDGIMALFGAPLPCADHAVRGCLAAVRMQAAVRRYAAALRRERDIDVQIRVGVNSGEVIVRAIDSDLGHDYTAVGPPTHVAARMEQLAQPGTTLITADTLRLASHAISARGVGRVAVKGLADEVEAFEIVAGPRRRPDPGLSLPEHWQGLLAEEAEGAQETHGERHDDGQGNSQEDGLGLERPRHIEDKAQHDPRQHHGERAPPQARRRPQARILHGEDPRDHQARGAERPPDHRLAQPRVASGGQG
jgi:class 3 adenylate cyclase